MALNSASLANKIKLKRWKKVRKHTRIQSLLLLKKLMEKGRWIAMISIHLKSSRIPRMWQQRGMESSQPKNNQRSWKSLSQAKIAKRLLINTKLFLLIIYLSQVHTRAPTPTLRSLSCQLWNSEDGLGPAAYKKSNQIRSKTYMTMNLATWESMSCQTRKTSLSLRKQM